MNPNKQHLASALSATVESITDWLYDTGAMKGRDKREPGYRTKQRAEQRLQAIVTRHFRTQKAAVMRVLEMQPPLKSVKAVQYDFYGAALADPEFLTQVLRLFTQFAVDGARIMAEVLNIAVDDAPVNLAAAKWAAKYSHLFVERLTTGTRDALDQAIKTFVETPGYTIGDVVDALNLSDTARAERIAVTEVTRAYAMGNQTYGEQLKKENPDVKVVKIWYTNNDDKVCDLCGPLDGTEVEIDQPFYEVDEDSLDDSGNPPRHTNCRCWTDSRTRING